MEIPNSFYYLVGALILTNLGTIGSVLLFGAKAVWFIAKMDSRIHESKEVGVRAHKRIDKIEDLAIQRDL